MTCFDCAPRVFVVFGALAGIGLGHAHHQSLWWVLPDLLAGACVALVFYFVCLFLLALSMWLLDKSQGGTSTLWTPRKK